MLSNAPQLLAILALIFAVVGIAFTRFPLVPLAVILLAIAVLLGTTT